MIHVKLEILLNDAQNFSSCLTENIQMAITKTNNLILFRIIMGVFQRIRYRYTLWEIKGKDTTYYSRWYIQ
jgi:hypothetical protein